MNASQILQTAMALSNIVRQLLNTIPVDELTEEEKQAITVERNSLNNQWAALAPPDDQS